MLYLPNQHQQKPVRGPSYVHHAARLHPYFRFIYLINHRIQPQPYLT